MAEYSYDPGSSRNQSVNKTLAILSTFNEATPMQRTSEIAARLGLHISTVSRHLNTLLDSGFLSRDDDTGYYYPGIKIVSLAGITLQNTDVYRHSYSEIQALAHSAKVYSHMSIPDGTDIVHLICISGKSSNDLMIPMGHRHPMYCSAMGRIILAYMPKDQVSSILKRSHLEKHTAETLISEPEICQEIEKARKQGYCVLQNELTHGVASVAAPVFNRSRIPVAAISISTSIWRLDQPQSERELSKAVISAANNISGKLGYYPR